MNLIDCRNIIINKYPQFNDSDFVENSKGWSNYVVIVDNQYIFRFPKNEQSLKMLNIERRILPYFKEKTTAPIPNFEFVSDEESAVSFVGYELIKGKELSVEILKGLDESDYQYVVKEIGQFLKSLHSLDVESQSISPLLLENRHKGWMKFKEVFLSQSEGYLTQRDINWINELFAEFYRNYSVLENGLKVIHGDFTDDHILIDQGKMVLGFIDFGDISLGDPAFDFAGLYLSYGKKFMSDVLSEYKLDVDNDFISRIEDFYIKQVCFHDLLYGIEIKDGEMIEKALQQIRKMMGAS